MKRSLVAAVVLLLGCTSSQTTGEPPASTPGPVPSAPAPEAPAPTAPSPTVVATPAVAPTPPVPPGEATQKLLDALVPEAERIAVTNEAAKALEIRVIDFDLWVTDGTRRAPLRLRASEVATVTVGHDATGEPTLVVDYQDDVSCDDPAKHVELSARSLLARLENAAAMKPHGKRDFETSARGFAKAAQLDPSLDVAWINLACALAMGGKRPSAIAALAPMLQRKPLYTAHKVLSDPELAALREAPELVALRAPKPGTAAIRTLTLAYSPHLSLVAVHRVEDSWGACNFVEDLRLIDAKTGKEVLTLPLVGWDESEPECDDHEPGRRIRAGHRARIDARLDTMDRFLRDMGFSVSEGLELVDPGTAAPDDGPVTRARLPGAGLELVIDDQELHVMKAGKTLATVPQTEAQGISHAGHDPAAGVAFIEWFHDVPEGCDDESDGTGFIVVPLASRP